MKQYRLWYDKPAPNRGIKELQNPGFKWNAKDADWEEWSLPLGGGHFGINIFGRTDTERIQVTEVSLANPYPTGVNNFAEVYLDINHPEEEISNYSRDLVLNDATAHTKYDYQGVTYQREYFTSYPDAVMAVKLSASKPGHTTFTLRPETPYLKPFNTVQDMMGNFIGKTGKVTAKDNFITLEGEMECHGISYEGQLYVSTEGGIIEAQDGALYIKEADSAVILMAVGTNYVLHENAWLEQDLSKKLAGNPHPHEKVTHIMAAAAAKTYEELRQRHVEDYSRFFNRVNVDLGGIPSLPTDKLLESYKAGNHCPYLEELYFQYGRYLLIASSRKGTLPGNLQGLWNQYDSSPWSAGYWHNINIQMNYWPAFTTNLAEMFESYADLNKGFRKLALENADQYLQQIHDENPDVEYIIPMDAPSQNGWAVGTGVSPYRASRPAPGGHSGPGTGALTAKMFWDYYDYTRDTTALKETVYPVLSGMSNFLSKVVIEKDGLLLAHPSASPEVRLASEEQGESFANGYTGPHYQTTGCAFDQQMIYENHKDLIAAAGILGISEKIVDIAKEQINKLDPIIIGGSGQVKEYREEDKYAEYGDPHHRHISQLVALSPGQVINSSTPEWMEAAKVTLTKRGDKSTGWAMAHRLMCWARAQVGSRAYELYQMLLKTGTLNNLWDTHPPFQIDGNYGGTAGVAEMLLQSNGNIIEPLAALPPSWAAGSYDGLVARGNFVIGCEWAQGKLTKLTITPRVGGVCQVRYPGIQGAQVTDNQGNIIERASAGADIVIDTVLGDIYTCTLI